MDKRQYFPEIDGLRAISVLLILYYHLDLPQLYGGFIGVDVFFVISGFLITRILLSDQERGAFSLGEFYRRRFTRILPALLVTLGAVFLISLIVYPPAVLIHAMKQVMAATLSVSNIFFWTQSGYWAPDSQNSVLLHTWSLGVEEQFYLLFPLLFMALFKWFGKTGLVLLTGGLFVTSLLFGEWMLARDGSAAYFLSPFRLYGLALGALAVILEPYWRGRLGAISSSGVTLAGLLLIAYAATQINVFSGFPGFDAIYPSVGSLLVILGGTSTLAALLLANSPMRWMGRISYALYLVHWPLIVFYRYLFGPELTWPVQIALGLGAVLLAAVLHYGVEQRFRMGANQEMTRSGIATSRVVAGMALVCVLLVAGSGLVIYSGGLAWRIPQNAHHLAVANPVQFNQEVNRELNSQCQPRERHFCGTRDPATDNIFLLGDSRGPDVYLALREAYPDHNIYASFAPGCVPVFNRAIGRSIFIENCPELNQQRLQMALDAPAGEIVFLGFSFNNWRAQATQQTVQRLLDSGKRVFILGESIFLRGKEPGQLAIDMARFDLSEDYVSRFLVARPFALDAMQTPVFEGMGATYVGQRNFFFQDGKYRLYTASGDQLLSFDGVHMTAAGARELGEYLREHYPLAAARKEE